jgi:formylglycine-generating enzyme required for sulfatase activity
VRSLAGQTLGPYHLAEEVGRGAQGAVYRASHPRFGAVAVKVLLGDGARHDERFRREAAVLCTIDHPYVTRALDVGQAAGMRYLVMPFVEGSDLKQEVTRRGALPIEECVRLTAAVADALAACHSQDVIHRDVKPSNVRVNASNGAPTLVDFGMVGRDALLSSEGGLTATGEMVGTPDYVSPEQVDAQATFKSDVYSLGATLFFLLTAHTPFRGGSVISVLTAMLRDPPPDPREFRPEIPAALATLCMRTLAKKPGERPTAAEFARELRSGEAPSRAPGPMALIVAVFLLLLGGALGFAVRGTTGAPSATPSPSAESTLDTRGEAPDEASSGKKLDSQGARALLAERTLWNAAQPQVQDQAIAWVTHRMADTLEHVTTRSYACNGARHRIATFRHRKTRAELNLIPGGTYMRGSHVVEEAEWVRPLNPTYVRWVRREGPPVETRVEPFLIGHRELTYREWNYSLTPSERETVPEGRPMGETTWKSAQGWTQAAELRLPSVAEWEYAARAGTTTRFFWGDEIDPSYAWFRDNTRTPHLVSEHADRLNAFGLRDVAGNVNEWVSDVWRPRPGSGDPEPKERERRGGEARDYAVSLRSAARSKRKLTQHKKGDRSGLRVALSLP